MAGEENGYAVFGKVVSGMDVVKKIEFTQTTTKSPDGLPMRDWPAINIVIEKAYIKK